MISSEQFNNILGTVEWTLIQSLRNINCFQHVTKYPISWLHYVQVEWLLSCDRIKEIWSEQDVDWVHPPHDIYPQIVNAHPWHTRPRPLLKSIVDRGRLHQLECLVFDQLRKTVGVRTALFYLSVRYDIIHMVVYDIHIFYKGYVKYIIYKQMKSLYIWAVKEF